MRCLIIKPGLRPYIADIPNELENLQAAVGGYIETVRLSDTAALLVNEEGKLLGLPLNRVILDKRGQLRDTLVGNILIVGVKGQEFCDLSPSEIWFYDQAFGHRANRAVFL